MHFLQNSQRERAEIKNLHSHMCMNVISSSGRFALPPLFGELEQRGVPIRDYVIYGRPLIWNLSFELSGRMSMFALPGLVFLT